MSAPTDARDFEALLDYLKRSRGFDFTAYKRPGLMRRVQKRMQLVAVDGCSPYVDYLEVHPEEFAHLFNTILINVTSFFRDPESWEYLAQEILPALLAAKGPHDPIRVWSAGCASGEEAYTLAMLWAEVLGLEAFQKRVKIYATDADEEALNKARQASYSVQDVGSVPPALLEKYFELNTNHYVFNKELRRSVIFGRLDLIQDAPISRLDLLVCRNVLMYFNAEVQSRILGRFHFALNDQGFVFLGKAEMLLTQTSTFTPLNLKRRVFSKVPRINLRDRLLIVAQTGREETVENNLVNHVRIREAAFESDPLPQLVVDNNGLLALASEKARSLFNLTFQDLGRPFQDLEVSYRPVELRSYIEKTYADRQPILLKDVAWPGGNGDPRFMEIQIVPLLDVGGTSLGVKLIFADVTRIKQLQDELQRSHQELETAYEEIQTSNEELQSTNEELETTNEELQSTNEELETMNEELQSSNEELRTINDELQQRTEDLNQVNLFLESILGSLRTAVAVLDLNLQVQIWNGKAEDMWGLRAEEVHGKHFLNLDIGLPLDALKQPIRACLAGEPTHDLLIAAVNRRGKTIQCHFNCSPLAGKPKESQGVILLMEERAGQPQH